MLADLEAAFAAMERWTMSHPLIGFAVMGFMGGIVAVLRMYELVGMKLSLLGFFGRCLVKGLVGLFVAVVVFFGWRASGFAQDWGYIAAAVSGVWGTEVLEVIFVMGIEVVRRKAGLAPAPAATVSKAGDPEATLPPKPGV